MAEGRANNKITGWNRIRVTSANEPKIEKDPNLAQTNRRFQSGAFFGYVLTSCSAFLDIIFYPFVS